jgi:hypothetical protein
MPLKNSSTPARSPRSPQGACRLVGADLVQDVREGLGVIPFGWHRPSVTRRWGTNPPFLDVRTSVRLQVGERNASLGSQRLGPSRIVDWPEEVISPP